MSLARFVSFVRWQTSLGDGEEYVNIQYVAFINLIT